MNISVLIRRMSEAGAPMEAIAIAVEEIEAINSALDTHRTAARERKRAQRERQKTADVTGQSQDMSQQSPSPLIPPKVFPAPLSNNPPIIPQPGTQISAGAKKSKKATRLSASWVPKELNGKAKDMVAQWPHGLIDREEAKFRNFWFAKGGKDACKIDWQRTWINWLMNADERRPRNERDSSGPEGLARKYREERERERTTH